METWCNTWIHALEYEYKLKSMDSGGFEGITQKLYPKLIQSKIVTADCFSYIMQGASNSTTISSSIIYFWN